MAHRADYESWTIASIDQLVEARRKFYEAKNADDRREVRRVIELVH